MISVRLPVVSTTGMLSFAKVMAHCGGLPAAAVSYIAQAIAAGPDDPEPYAALTDLRREMPAEIAALINGATTPGLALARSFYSFLDGTMTGAMTGAVDDAVDDAVAGAMDDAVMSLGSVSGFQPDVPWASAPWFSDPRFLDAVTPAALAEATMRINDYGHVLDSDAVRACLVPWFRAVDVVCAREADPDAMARMAILLRECGRTEASFALCDRADAVQPLAFTEVVRAGTWRRSGDPVETAAAFRRALVLDPDNWSLHLDLADLAAARGDFVEAAALANRGEDLEPDDAMMRAAAAAYRARSTGSVADLALLEELAPQVALPYRQTLLDHAKGSEPPP